MASGSVLKYLNVQLRLQADDFNKGIRAAQREATELQKTLKPTASVLSDMGKAATSAGKVLTVAFTAPIAAIAGVGLAFNSMQERAQIAFTGMLGDGKKAAAFLSELKDFAAKTPFEFEDLVRASQRLMAMGFAAKDVRPLLTSVGDAVAGLGGGAAEIDRVTLALGQMQGRGKVATQEMNQLTEVGIPAWAILAQKFGIAESKLRDMVEKGVVPADKAIRALQEGMGEKFAGQMVKNSQTLMGLFSTIKDETKFIAGELTEGLNNALKGPLSKLGEVLHGIRVRMDGLSDGTKAAIVVMGGLVAAAGPALFIFGQLAQSVSAIILVAPKLVAGLHSIQAALIAMQVSAAGAIASLGTAGLVGVIIVAAAALVTLTYKIAEATGLIDALANKIARWRGLMAETDSALAKNSAGLERNIQFLKDHGITVDRAGKTTQQLEQEVAKLTREYYGLDKAQPQVKKSVIALTGAIVDQGKAAKETAELLHKQQMAAISMSSAMSRMAKETQKDIQDGIEDEVKAAESANDRIARDTIDRFERIKNSNRDMQDLINIANRGTADEASRVNEEAYDQIIADMKDAEAQSKKSATGMSRAWETAIGNIASRFSDTIADMIVEWDFGWKGMVDILKDTAKSLLSAFISGFIEPALRSAAGLGGQLGRIIFGGQGGGGGGQGGGGILGGIFGGGGGSGGGSGSGPMGGALSGANIGGYFQAAEIAVGWFNGIGAGRRAANQIVKSQEAVWASIADLFNKRDAGSLASLMSARAVIDQTFADWQKNALAFAGNNEDNTVVVNQAFATLIPLITKMRAEMDAQIAALGGVPGADGSIINFQPVVTAIQSLGELLRESMSLTAHWLVDQWEGASQPFMGASEFGMDIPDISPEVPIIADGSDSGYSDLSSMVSAVSSEGVFIENVTFSPTISITCEIDGEFSRQDIRLKLMPEITSALQTGIEGYREEWTRIFAGALAAPAES